MKIKRNKKSYKWFLCGLILVVVLTISYRVSKANYRISNSIELTTGKVVSSPYDFNIVSMYIDGVEQSKDIIILDSGYVINEEQSYCYKESKSNKDNNARLFTDSLGNHVFKGISKGTKCIVYFDKIGNTMEDLLSNYYTDKRIRTSENKDFNVPYEEETAKTVFSAEDDDGTSYYFAGNPLDNWVEFGSYYWRIIRINGNGSIRMIYQGRAYDENGNKIEPQRTGEETQIGTSKFNEQYNDNKYVGYLYNENGEDKQSNVYKQLNNWFSSSNIKQGSVYFNKIDLDAGFCGDRTSYLDINGSTSGGGKENIETFYGAYVRLRPGETSITVTSTAVTPTLNCTQNDDLYTYIEANKGNKKLANPVGMITADEISFAGLIFATNTFARTNYLDTHQQYWTMSPFWYKNGDASVFYMYSPGCLGSSNGAYELLSYAGIRPTINLKKDVTFTGNGTQHNPFKVVGS